MALSLDPKNLLDAATISKFIFGVDDVTLTAQLTAQQVTALELMADAASEQVTDYVDFAIKEATYTEVWDGAASDELIPHEVPISAINSVKFAANGDFASVSPLPVTAAVIGSRGMVINLRDNLLTPRGRGVVQIVYVAGYAVVPKLIQMATLKQLQYLYKQMGKGDAMVGLKSIAKMNESQTKDDSLAKSGLLAEVEGMLKGYCRFESPNSIMFTRVT